MASIDWCPLIRARQNPCPLARSKWFSCAGQAGFPGNLPAGQVKLSPRLQQRTHLVTSHYDISSLSEEYCILSFTAQGRNGIQKKEIRASKNKLQASGPKPQLAPRTLISCKFISRCTLPHPPHAPCPHMSPAPNAPAPHAPPAPTCPPFRGHINTTN